MVCLHILGPARMLELEQRDMPLRRGKTERKSKIPPLTDRKSLKDRTSPRKWFAKQQQCASTQQRRRRTFFEKITNLSLHGRRIRAIRNLHMCTNLRVLFLYSNCIERIENLSFAKNLTHLYLENNRIRRIEDLANLARLTKLSLDGNCISTLEGLEGCSSLTELHLSNQRLELGQTFKFDPQSIAGLADSLQLLTVANSQVESIAPLGGLANLQVLRASHNPHLAGGVDSLEELIRGCVFLQEVDFAHTPLAATPNYRDTLIAKSEYVSLIDGKLVQANQREFLQARARRRTLGRAVKPHLGATGKGLTQSLTANMDVVGSSTLLSGPTSTTTSSNNQDSQASFGSTPSATTHFTASSVPSASSGLARPRLSLVARHPMSSRLPSRTLSSSAESQLLQASFSGFLNAKPVSLEHCR